MNPDINNPNPNPAPTVPPIIAATPPVIPAQAAAAQAAAPALAPEVDLKPIDSLGAAIEAILRQPRKVFFHLGQPNAGMLTVALLIIATVGALVYGFVIGTFSGGAQYWAAPIKVAGGLLVSAFICLPSLYIFACISGSPARLKEVAGLQAGLLALMTVLLLGFAPVAWVFSQSTESEIVMGLLHLLFWAVACGFAVHFLTTGFRQISGKDVGAVKVWVVIFVLVMLQMTAALRPLVGTADTFLPTEKKFFLGHWLSCLEKVVDEADERKSHRH